MNQKRRKKLKEAKEGLRQVDTILESVLDDESDALSNWPESLEGTDRYQESETACDCIEDAITAIADATELLDRIITRSL